MFVKQMNKWMQWTWDQNENPIINIFNLRRALAMFLIEICNQWQFNSRENQVYHG